MKKEIILVVGVKSNGKESKDEVLKMVEDHITKGLNVPVTSVSIMDFAELNKYLNELTSDLDDVEIEITNKVVSLFNVFVKVRLNVSEAEFKYIRQMLRNIDIDTNIVILLAYLTGEDIAEERKNVKSKKRKRYNFAYLNFPTLLPTYRLSDDRNLYKSVHSFNVYDLEYLKSLKGRILNVVKFTGLDRANSSALLRTVLEIKVLSTKTFDYNSENFIKVGTYKIKNIDLSEGRIVITGTLKVPKYLNKDLDIDTCCDLKPISLTMTKEGRKMVKEIIGFELINMCEVVSKQRETLRDIYGS